MSAAAASPLPSDPPRPSDDGPPGDTDLPRMTDEGSPHDPLPARRAADRAVGPVIVPGSIRWRGLTAELEIRRQWRECLDRLVANQKTPASGDGTTPGPAAAAVDEPVVVLRESTPAAHRPGDLD